MSNIPHSFTIIGRVLKPAVAGPSLTFKEFHVLEAIELMGKEKNIGRTRLAKELAWEKVRLEHS